MNTARWSTLCFLYSSSFFILCLFSLCFSAPLSSYVLLCIASLLLLIGALLAFAEARKYRLSKSEGSVPSKSVR